MKYFDRLHPLPAFVYFLMILLLTMFTSHPVAVGISYFSALFFCGMLLGVKKLFASLAYTLPITLLIALANPLFVHRGETILFFLNDNPVTLEAILYGVQSAFMIMAVFYWCRNYSRVMTSDKFIYLFGRILPKLSLIFSLSLAFLPKLKRKYREIDRAQKALGFYAGKSRFDKVRAKMRVLSILLTNSLESAVTTADSMCARGYGLKGRSSFALYRVTPADMAFLAATLLAGSALVVMLFFGVGDFHYYPAMSKLSWSPLFSCFVLIFALLAFLPTASEIREDLLWHRLRSKI